MNPPRVAQTILKLTTFRVGMVANDIFRGYATYCHSTPRLNSVVRATLLKPVSRAFGSGSTYVIESLEIEFRVGSAFVSRATLMKRAVLAKDAIIE